MGSFIHSEVQYSSQPIGTNRIQVGSLNLVRPVATAAFHPHDKDEADFAHDDNPSSVIAVNGEIADSSAGFAFCTVEVHSRHGTGVPVLYRRGIRTGKAVPFRQILEDAVRIQYHLVASLGG